MEADPLSVILEHVNEVREVARLDAVRRQGATRALRELAEAVGLVRKSFAPGSTEAALVNAAVARAHEAAEVILGV